MLFTCGALFLPLLATAAAAEETRRETWYEFNFHGKKVGFLHAVDERATLEGRPALHAQRRSVVTVRRQEHVIRMEATTDAWADPKGRPIRFTHSRDEGGASRTIEGFREGSAFVIRHTVGSNRTEKRHPLDAGVYLSSTLDLVFKTGLAPSSALSGRAIVEEDGELREFDAKVLRRETNGDFVVESRVGNVTSTEWVTPDGTTQRTEVPRLGAEFVATDREKALRLERTEDIFSAARLLAHVRLPSGNALDELVVRMTGRSGRAPAPIADDRQRVKKLGQGAVELSVRTPVLPPRAAKLPIRSAAVSRYLAATPYEATNNEQLIRKARQVIGDAPDAWMAAKRINAFVNEHIRDKSLAHAYATASEALDARAGDCTEHAVLFSALAKIVGIPTKLVTGLVYVGGPEGIFGYHQWVEVWVGDRWIGMDPTFGQDVADPTHIKFTEGLSDADGLRDAGIAAAELFGDITLKVVEYRTSDGQRKKFEGS